jgi:hypothetical protein
MGTGFGMRDRTECMFASATYTLRERQFASLCQQLLVDLKQILEWQYSTLEGTECLNNRNFHWRGFSTTSLFTTSLFNYALWRNSRNSVTFSSSWTSFNLFTRRRLSGSRSNPWLHILEDLQIWDDALKVNLPNTNVDSAVMSRRTCPVHSQVES